MKRVLLRTICLTLTLLMLFGLVACKGEKDELILDTSETVATEDVSKSKVPADLNFGGDAEVTVMAQKSYAEEFTPDNQTAIIDAAVLQRNLLVEERLGIKFNFLYRDEDFTGAYQNVIRNMILSGDGGIDIIQSHAYYTAKVASEGLFYNFNSDDEKNYISPELEWYNQSFVNNTSYHDKLYFLVGDVTLGATNKAPVIFFNEDGLKQWQIEDNLYEKALEGNWTIEYMKTLVKNVYSDIDTENGESSGDYYGLYFSGGSMCIDAMISAVGINITSTDTNGDISVVWGSTKDTMGFQAIYKLMYETDGVFTGTIANNTYRGEMSQYFSEDAFYYGRALFATGMLCAAKNFALNPDIHFGMLPLPKVNATDEYRTTPQDSFPVMSIPHNIASRVDIATATLEMMSEYSYNVVRPVYHDTAYKIRYASGENTALLFDTVIDSIYFEFGTFYSNAIGNPVHQLRNKLTGSGTTLGSNLMSVTAQYTSSTEMHLRELLKAFDNLG